MSNDNALLTLGQLAGLAMRMTLAEAEAAARTEGLTEHNRRMAEIGVNFRRELEQFFRSESPK